MCRRRDQFPDSLRSNPMFGDFARNSRQGLHSVQITNGAQNLPNHQEEHPPDVDSKWRALSFLYLGVVLSLKDYQ